MTTGATREVAAWVAGLRPGDLPGPTAGVVRAAVLDTLGAGLHGHGTPWARAVRDWAEREAGPAPRASVWGAAAPALRAADAALVNGVAAHAFELDDYHNAKIHPGAVVIPAALALAEALDADGGRLEVAIAAGYEVMIRAALALEPAAARLRGWHLTGVCGPLGAAAAGAHLLGLDAERTAWALGLGGTQGSGLFAFNADGSAGKRFHPGRAAHAGVLAAELAQAGLDGPAQVFEAQDGGFLRAFSDAPRPERLTDGLGEVFHTDGVCFKPYACCGSLHAHVDAARALRARLGAPPGPAARVQVGLGRVAALQCGFPYEPSTVMHAQMSARYCVAVALLEGAALPAQFGAGRLRDPAIVALAQRLELVRDAALDGLYPEHFAGWVSVGTPGGTERVDVRDPTGSPAHPMDAAALGAKWAALAGGCLGPEALARTEAAVARLHATPARALVRGLRWA